MRPTVGRIVHYLDREQVVSRKENAQPYAAVIVAVHPANAVTPIDTVDLAVFHPELGYQRRAGVPYGDGASSWSWPPREEAPAVQGEARKKK